MRRPRWSGVRTEQEIGKAVLRVRPYRALKGPYLLGDASWAMPHGPCLMGHASRTKPSCIARRPVAVRTMPGRCYAAGPEGPRDAIVLKRRRSRRLSDQRCVHDAMKFLFDFTAQMLAGF
jgi:hypothetical protein